MQIIKQLLFESLEIILPSTCSECSSRIDPIDNLGICRNCLKKIKLFKSPLCPRCGEELSTYSSGPCPYCKNKVFNFDRLICLARYQGVVKTCIHLLKYKRKKNLSVYLGQIMLDFLKTHFQINNIDLIVPVPAHRFKQRERGFNQSFLLANYLSEKLHLAIDTNILIKIRFFRKNRRYD